MNFLTSKLVIKKIQNFKHYKFCKTTKRSENFQCAEPIGTGRALKTTPAEKSTGKLFRGLRAGPKIGLRRRHALLPPSDCGSRGGHVSAAHMPASCLWAPHAGRAPRLPSRRRATALCERGAPPEPPPPFAARLRPKTPAWRGQGTSTVTSIWRRRRAPPSSGARHRRRSPSSISPRQGSLGGRALRGRRPPATPNTSSSPAGFSRRRRRGSSSQVKASAVILRAPLSSFAIF